MPYSTSDNYRNRRLDDAGIAFSIPCADTTGAAAVDDSANEFDGIYGGSPTLNQAGIGDELGAVQLANGTGQYISMIGDAALEAFLDGSEFTLEYWSFGINTALATENIALCRIGNTPAAGLFNINHRRSLGGGLFWLLDIDNGAFNETYTDALFDFDGWHHWALVVSNDENRVTFYIDGAQVAEFTNPTDLNTFDWGDRFFIGARSATQEEFSGRIAHIRCFTRPFSDAEVLQEFQYNQNPVFAGTISAQNDDAGEAITPLDTGAFYTENNAADTQTFTADDLPTGLSIASSTGIITGTPTTPDTHSVTVTSTDDGSPNLDTDSNTFEWVINAADPAIQAIDNAGYDENDAVTISPVVDGGTAPLVFSLDPTSDALPDGLSLNTGTGAITGTLSYDAAGIYDIVLLVTDDLARTDTEAFTLTISDINRAPVLQAIGNKTNTEGDTITPFSAVATDPDDDGITYGISGQPSGISINTGNGQISGTIAADANDSSPYTVTVTATDDGVGTLQDSEQFTWTINESGGEGDPEPEVEADSSTLLDPVLVAALKLRGRL